MDKAFTTYRIEDRSFISITKKEVQKLLKTNGFSTVKMGETDIIVSELCSNLIKHTDKGGQMLFRMINEGSDNPALELCCLDNGPGTNDIQRMMNDGVSSVNTLGQGLGAINRLSDFFQIYSMKGWGTVAYLKKYKGEKPTVREIRKEKIQINVIQEAIAHEKVCGDGYYVKHTPDETQIFVGDGLGHGPHAHTAVTEAIEAFKQCNEHEACDILRFLHDKVKKTRGLVASVAIINHKEKKWRICGVGNIMTRLYEGIDYKAVMAYNGIIGLNLPNTLKDTHIPAEKYQSIIMCSDGIKTKWDLSKYVSLLKYSPPIMAGCIFKDHARNTDDMTVLVGKLIL